MSIIATRKEFEAELLDFYNQCLDSNEHVTSWTKCQHSFLKHTFLKRQSLVLIKRQRQLKQAEESEIQMDDDLGVFEENDISVATHDNDNDDGDNDNNDGNSESIKMEHHIVYSTSYQVPVIYFQAFFQDGTPLDFKDIYQYIIPKYYHQELSGLAQNPISQTDHPELGTPFWYIHPCDTRILMDSIGFKSSNHHNCNYIKTWLSFYGPLVKCNLSTTLFQ